MTHVYLGVHLLLTLTMPVPLIESFYHQYRGRPACSFAVCPNSVLVTAWLNFFYPQLPEIYSDVAQSERTCQFIYSAGYGLKCGVLALQNVFWCSSIMTHNVHTGALPACSVFSRSVWSVFGEEIRIYFRNLVKTFDLATIATTLADPGYQTLDTAVESKSSTNWASQTSYS